MLSIVLLRFRLSLDRFLTGSRSGLSALNSVLHKEDDVVALAKRLSSSTEATILGATLHTHMPFFLPHLKEMAARGGRVRVLLVAPDSEATRMAADRAGVSSDTQLTLAVRQSLSELKLIGEQFRNVQVKNTKYLPPATLFAFDHTSEKGYLEVRFSTYRGGHTSRPTLKISRGDDLEWFEWFMADFDRLWEASQEA